jgi:hypothetical protein
VEMDGIKLVSFLPEEETQTYSGTD